MSLLARGARPGDSVADVRRREGELTLGLWLPLAFATLVQCVIGIAQKPPKRSELLATWALPELSRAVRRDEEAGENERLGEWIEDIERRFGRQANGD